MDKIDLALKKIDEESETPELFSEIVFTLTQDEQKKSAVFSLLRTAIKYVCFMDLYHETGNKEYNDESGRQRELLYSNTDKSNHKQLKNLEEKLLPYWKYEESLRTKIREGHKFSQAEIEAYVLRRSEDSIFYSTLAGFYCDFSLNLFEVMHKRQALADLVDSIKDYEEDIKIGEPNILILYFLSRGVKGHPQDLNKGLDLASELGITDKILWSGNKLYQTSLENLEIENIPRLKKEIECKYELLKNMVKNGK